MKVELMYKLRCDSCGVIESEDRDDGLFEDLHDAVLRADAHEETTGENHAVAIIGGFLPSLEPQT